MKHPLDGQVNEIAFKVVENRKVIGKNKQSEVEYQALDYKIKSKRRHYFVYLVYTQEQFEMACPSKIKRAVIKVISLILPRILKVKIIRDINK